MGQGKILGPYGFLTDLWPKQDFEVIISLAATFRINYVIRLHCVKYRAGTSIMHFNEPQKIVRKKWIFLK